MTRLIFDAMAARPRILPSGQAVARHAAGLIADVLRSGIASKGSGVLAVSGGKTPLPTFERLTTCDIDWSRVCITLVDERWVEPTSSDSNEHLVRTHLLQGDVRSARFVPMKTSAVSPLAGIGRQLSSFRSLPSPIDAIVLGMGEDGHFASLFPGSPALQRGLDVQYELSSIAVPAGASGTAPHQERMSLTLSTIFNARVVILLTNGAVKRRVIQTALDKVCNPFELPVAALLATRPDTIILHGAS
jgi:6-phosphogluconolactonase